MTEAVLRSALNGLRLKDQVVEVDGRFGRWMVRVTSPDYIGVPEADRQSAVWNHLLKVLSDGEIATVDFVFTMTPDEVQALNQQAAS